VVVGAESSATLITATAATVEPALARTGTAMIAATQAALALAHAQCFLT
jgi:hypothetical protein